MHLKSINLILFNSTTHSRTVEYKYFWKANKLFNCVSTLVWAELVLKPSANNKLRAPNYEMKEFILFPVILRSLKTHLNFVPNDFWTPMENL